MKIPRFHFHSKKFTFATLSVFAMVLAAFLSRWVPEMVALFPALVGGITGVAGLFLAGDVASQHVSSKATALKPEEPAPEPPADPAAAPK